jgi:hypothetical protein
MPTSLLNFLAGLFAGAGINLLTSLATAPPDAPTTAIEIDAAVWIGAAAATTAWAYVSETIDRRIQAKIQDGLVARIHGGLHDGLQDFEIAGIRRDERGKLIAWLRRTQVATGVFVVLGLLLVPHLILR